MIELKDYLHYYKNIQVKTGSWFPRETGERVLHGCNNIGTIPVAIVGFYSPNYDNAQTSHSKEIPISDIKPILRRLSDISRDEVEKCGEIIDPNKEYEDEYNGYTYTHFDVGKLFVGSFENNSDEYCVAFKKIMPALHYLLKQGFDLFSLIENGLAIDKKNFKR